MKTIAELEENNEKEERMSTGQMMQRRFLKDRKVILWGEITDDSGRDIMERLLYLEWNAPGEEITLYLNSPGGSITAGMAIYDTMKLISSPLRVVVMGMAASMAATLLCAGAKGKRLVYPHSRVLIHQPLISGRMMGAAVDIHIQAQEMEKLREEMNRIYVETTGQSMDQIKRDTDRDFYLSAQEAIDYGLADAIVESV